MKTLFFSLFILSLTPAFAQQNTKVNRDHILIDGSIQTSQLNVQIEQLKLLVQVRRTVEELYQINANLNAELDDLIRENQRLGEQNVALQVRNMQLKVSDQIEIDQNVKQMRHNEKLISRNDKIILANAITIETNQEMIAANEELLGQLEQKFEPLATSN